ncbi:MAG TPA: hypothetical protein VG123_19010 [Streptosporangiaceae bacterium]|nr:hypothetical protein [Streptosporangiaceae bacterium]
MRLGPHLTGRQILGSRPQITGEPRAVAQPSWLARLGLARFGLERLGPVWPRVRRLGTHRGADPGGTAFALVTVLPALAIAAWLLAGLPLLLAGRFLPVPMVLISVPVAVGLVILTGRHIPGRWPGHGPGEREPGADRDGSSGREAGADREAGGERDGGDQAGGSGWAAWLGLAGTIAVAAGFAVWQFHANSPELLTDRDPGAYFQFGYWIAEHGSLPIPAMLTAFGGSHSGLTFASFAFTSQGSAVVPQLTAGLPITLAAGLWVSGIAGGVAMSPLLGAFGVVTVGGLTGRLAGPQWAPAGAFLLALTLPEAYTSRSAFSEVLAQILLFGGLCLVVDSLLARRPQVLAAVGGFLLGLSVLAEIRSLLYLLPVIVFLGVLLAGRRPQGLPFEAGLLVGAGYGLAGGYLLAGPMMAALAPQLGRIALAAAAFLVVTAAGTAVAMAGPARRRAVWLLAGRPLRWLPEAAAAVVVLAAAGFLVRPYVQTVTGAANPYVAALQRIAQLPVDPRRLYAEDSFYWLIWYLGAPALLLGVAGLAMLTQRCLRALITWRDPSRVARVWALPLLIIGWGAVTVLWRPGTTPDQPWASRQLVPVLIPGLVVPAIWVCSWLAARARERGAGTAAVTAVVVCLVAALAVPPTATLFGIGARPASSPALRPAHGGLAFVRTGTGVMPAVRQLCAALPQNSSVLLLDQVSAREFSQVIRGMCGVPAAVMAGAAPSQVDAVVGEITRGGRRAVLLAASPAELSPYRPAPRRVLALSTVQDAHVLTQPPASGWPVRYVLWMSGPGAAAQLPGRA